jgi:hypothetical protein
MSVIGCDGRVGVRRTLVDASTRLANTAELWPTLDLASDRRF